MSRVVVDEGIDSGAVAHYGSPSREERALAAGTAVTELPQLEVVQVTGPDRAAWLNSLTTQQLVNETAGVSTETLLLDPGGRVENAAGVFDDGEATWLLLDVGYAGPMADFLTSMIFMKRVSVCRRGDLMGIAARGEARSFLSGIALRGGATADVPLVWNDPWPYTKAGGAHYGTQDAEHPGAGWEAAIALVQRDHCAEAMDAAEQHGLTKAGILAWEAARVTAWRPRPSAEIVENVLPHELDWLRTAVHLKKGCYRGQESVAKIVNLGKPPRRLVELFLEGPIDELPLRGDPVLADGTPVGMITSAVRDAEDGPVALALVRRSVSPDAVLDVGAFRGGQQVIVDPSGKSSESPTERPGKEFRRRLL